MLLECLDGPDLWRLYFTVKVGRVRRRLTRKVLLSIGRLLILRDFVCCRNLLVLFVVRRLRLVFLVMISRRGWYLHRLGDSGPAGG